MLDPPSYTREASPALSSTTLSSLPTSTAGSTVNLQSHTATTAGEPPRKRRKLTVQEKEEQRKEKEERAKLRDEKRVQKEAEAAVKEEERRAKAEERRAKNEEREAKQREKDLIKQQKEEEEAKKARAQKRLGAFFSNQATAKSKAATGPLPSQLNEGHPAVAPAPPPETTSESISQVSMALSDYDRFFLPFELPSHSSWPTNLLASKPEHDSAAAQSAFDNAAQGLTSTSAPPVSRYFKAPTRQKRALFTVASCMKNLMRSSDDAENSIAHSAAMIKDVVMKHIHFCEDVRPPYTGSFTKITSQTRAHKFGRTPFSRTRDDTNYDYDSEVEWEEPEEGEDIGSDGEDDAESTTSADEMDGFLDDGDDSQATRKLITSELVPVCSGICWEDEQAHAGQDGEVDLRSMRLEWLLDQPVKSINPFSTSYWEKPQVTPEPAAVVSPPAPRDLFGALIASPARLMNGPMKPPRAPLPPTMKSANSKTIVGAKSGEKGPIMAVAAIKTSKVAAVALAGSKFEEFKDAVEGSNLTKVELLKALKQRFPDIRNETLKETLSERFARVGNSADKRWVHIAT